MIFIYGSKSHQLTGAQIPDACPNCGTKNSVSIFVFQRYLHLFWIPVFPTEKTGVSICSHCKQSLKLKEMPQFMKTAYSEIRQKAKTPVWTFALLILIGVGVSAGLISDAVRHKTKTTAEEPSVVQSSDVIPATVSSESSTSEKTVFTIEDAQKSIAEFAPMLNDYKDALKTKDQEKNAAVNERYRVWHKTALDLLAGLKGKDLTGYLAFYQKASRQWVDAYLESNR